MKENVAEYLEARFKKLKLLKRSDKGEVWLASSKTSGEPVIIKRVSRTGLPYGALEKFSFKLPAKIFLCAEDETETVVVEEFIRGENLLERLEQKKFFGESQAREILLQLCEGLRELHERKIIHRDIKPSNLILQGERIRLIDFDAARIFKDEQETDTVALGTKGYAPPEQFGSGQTDPRSDIYSLGKTMKILLGGKCGGLKKILDKCTELDPKYRFQNVDELKSALTSNAANRYKKFSAVAILLAAGIFFINAPSLNREENFSAEVDSRAEEIVQSAPQKISAPQEKFRLPEMPEIVLPTNQPAPLPEPPKKITPPAPPREFTLPELTLPPVAPNQVEIPAQQEVSLPPRKNFSGKLKTEFYLNGELFDQFAHRSGEVKISRDKWRQSEARLRITNDTGDVWQNPEIHFFLGQNWGDRFDDTKTLPALASGESAEFVIPFNVFAVSDKENTSAYIQVYLYGDESKMDEHYWGVWFEVTD